MYKRSAKDTRTLPRNAAAFCFLLIASEDESFEERSPGRRR